VTTYWPAGRPVNSPMGMPPLMSIGSPPTKAKASLGPRGP
jgi:hypothetical protein